MDLKLVSNNDKPTTRVLPFSKFTVVFKPTWRTLFRQKVQIIEGVYPQLIMELDQKHIAFHYLGEPDGEAISSIYFTHSELNPTIEMITHEQIEKDVSNAKEEGSESQSEDD